MNPLLIFVSWRHRGTPHIGHIADTKKPRLTLCGRKVRGEFSYSYLRPVERCERCRKASKR